MRQSFSLSHRMGEGSGLSAYHCSAHAYLAPSQSERYLQRMVLTDLNVAEEALSLSPADRVELAKLLIRSLEGDGGTDKEMTAELNHRLQDLVSGKDPGVNFDQVFGKPA